MGLKSNVQRSRSVPVLDLEAVAGAIAATQNQDGEIPWSIGDKTDPWDHVESAMGLNIMGFREEAERAFDWLVGKQLEDGSWYASYINGEPEDMTRDTNMSSYIAVGVLHHFLIHQDESFLREMWRPVSRAIDFALRFQAPDGEIYWAASPTGIVDTMALLTGSSSVYMSIKCAEAIAYRLGCEREQWRLGRRRLGDAIRYRRHVFNMSKSRFSMDWFYPILCGALTGDDAHRRIRKRWDRFVVKGHGVLCVCDEPWVTVAETCELVLALNAMGNRGLARIVFDWISDRRYEDGSFYCGYTHPDMIVWPDQKITWTNAVALMAADALYDLTPAGQIFTHQFWNNTKDL